MSTDGLRSARWCDEYCQVIELTGSSASDECPILRLVDCVVDAVYVGNSQPPHEARMNDAHILCRDLVRTTERGFRMPILRTDRCLCS